MAAKIEPHPSWAMSDGKVAPMNLGAYTKALLVIESPHGEIHEGEHYFVDSYADLAINNVFDLLITTPNTNKWAHWTWDMLAENEVLWYVYERAVVTVAGTAMTAYNNDRNSPNTTILDFKYHLNADLVDANADTNVTAATAIQSGIIGSGRVAGGVERSENEIILRQGTIYCCRAIATAASYVSFRMSWYEHTNGH